MLCSDPVILGRTFSQDTASLHVIVRTVEATVSADRGDR